MAKKFLTSIDLCGNQLIRPVLENVFPNPVDGDSLAKGRIAFNTNDNNPIVYDGEYWRNLQYEIPKGTYLDKASYKSLVAIEDLTGTSGILKKIDADNWGLDTNTYLLSNANAASATKLKTPRAFSITGGATAEAISFDGESNVVLDVTSLDASKLTATIPSTVLGNSTFYVGTTPIKLNRSIGVLALTGISSIGLDSGNDTKPIIKYKDDDNAIYLTTEVNGALNLHVTGELTTSNILNEWGEYSPGKDNWFLSAKLGNDLHVKLTGKSDVEHNHNLSDLTEKSYNSLTDTPTLGDASSRSIGTASGNIPILGADGKLNDIVIPKIAISETSVVDSDETMLALTAEIGDIAIRTDSNKTFILKENNPKKLESWHELFTPTSLVTSVEGRTGAVMLSKTDVGLSNVDNTSDEDKPVSTAQQLALDKKVNKESGKGLISTSEITRLSTVTNQDVPTKLSELSNDEGFITREAIEDLGGGDMLKSIYDTNDKPGYVDKAIDSDTADKAKELSDARLFSIAGNTGLTATGVTFNGGKDVSLNLTGSLKVANGGTGLTEAKGGFTRKVMGILTTSATSYPITHGLGSDVVVQVIEVASKEVVECDIIMTSENMATIRFNKAPNANAYRYIIIG